MDYDKANLAELQAEAKRRKLPDTGTKLELRQRLRSDDEQREQTTAVQDDDEARESDDESAHPQPVDSPLQEGRADLERPRGTVTDEDGRQVGPDGPQPRDDGEDIAARTADSAEQSDDRYRKAYVVPPPARAGVADYDSDEHEEMHSANKAAMLESALHAGLHPKGHPDFDGHDTTADGSVRLWYSVEAIPASSDEDPAGTQTPSAEIDDQGGSTADPDRAPAGTEKFEQREDTPSTRG